MLLSLCGQALLGGGMVHEASRPAGGAGGGGGGRGGSVLCCRISVRCHSKAVMGMGPDGEVQELVRGASGEGCGLNALV